MYIVAQIIIVERLENAIIRYGRSREVVGAWSPQPVGTTGYEPRASRILCDKLFVEVIQVHHVLTDMDRIQVPQGSSARGPHNLSA